MGLFYSNQGVLSNHTLVLVFYCCCYKAMVYTNQRETVFSCSRIYNSVKHMYKPIDNSWALHVSIAYIFFDKGKVAHTCNIQVVVLGQEVLQANPYILIMGI